LKHDKKGGILVKKKCIFIANWAVQALLYELAASPKPGLVDRFDNGAHDDMNYYTFLKSINSLKCGFYNIAEVSNSFSGKGLKEWFSLITPIGRAMEREMLKATDGINTHKGAIFSLGIICSSVAYMMQHTSSDNLNSILIRNSIRNMTEGLCHQYLESITVSNHLSHGELLYKKYGITGIRGEAESGYKTVYEHGLPYLKENRELPINDLLVNTLLKLMTVTEDTNILWRHNSQTLEYVKDSATDALRKGGMKTEAGVKAIYQMNESYKAANISPGGSADLLAVTILLGLIDKAII